MIFDLQVENDHSVWLIFKTPIHSNGWLLILSPYGIVVVVSWIADQEAARIELQ